MFSTVGDAVGDTMMMVSFMFIETSVLNAELSLSMMIAESPTSASILPAVLCGCIQKREGGGGENEAGKCAFTKKGTPNKF